MVPSYTIITSGPSGVMVSIHNSIPVVLDRKGMDLSLGAETIQPTAVEGEMGSGAQSAMLRSNLSSRCDSMTLPANKVVVQRFYEQVFNQQRLDVIDELVAPDYIYNDPISPTLGPAGVRAMAGGFIAALPDLQFTIEDLIAEGDKVVTRFTARGTHRGELLGVAPTGRRVEVTGIIITRVEGGRLIEERESFDALGLKQQLEADTTSAATA